MTFQLGDPRFKDDTIFNIVNTRVVTMKPEEVKNYRAHLQSVLGELIEEMKKQDTLFKSCYERTDYVGSFYEGLKVGRPEEFDLNVVIRLPIDYQKLTPISTAETPGYIKIKTNEDVLPTLHNHVKYSSDYRGIDKWFDNSGFLNQDKFRQWFESVVTKASRSYEYVNKQWILDVNSTSYAFNNRKSGPAFTFRVFVPGGHSVDVDIVPALEFKTSPPPPFKSRNTQKQYWVAISKPLIGENSHLFWRPSFWSMEQECLGGELRGRVKAVIRQMKKLRDTENFKSIASYFIKTLFLHELETRCGKVGGNNRSNPEFERSSLTCLFVYMLEKLYRACKEGAIYDFWNPQFNLLSKIGRIELENIANRLNRIIRSIDRNIDTDKYIIAQYVLNSEEFKLVKTREISYFEPEERMIEPIENPRCDQNQESNFWLNLGIGVGVTAIAITGVMHALNRNNPRD